MRKVGKPVTIRIDETSLVIAERQAKRLNKPLRSYLRELLEYDIDGSVYKEREGTNLQKKRVK